MREWESDLKGRSDAEAKSLQGKMAMATFMGTTQHIAPLFSRLRSHSLHKEIRSHLYKICYELVHKRYIKAHDAYIMLAIGNAAWPMGVTQVGIHERAGRSRIFDSQTAHILNDETQRKFIQAVKRLMSFAQQKRPTKPSQMVMN